MLADQEKKERRSVIPSLRETKIVAALRDGLQDLAAQSIVALVLGEIKLCDV